MVSCFYYGKNRRNFYVEYDCTLFQFYRRHDSCCGMSLQISPKEQTQVMERIFGDGSVYSEETQEQLKQAMLIEDPGTEGVSVYGKTGQGATAEATVDAWFTGFADSDGKRIYYCVHLGETEGTDISSAKAREIAVRILREEVSPS